MSRRNENNACIPHWRFKLDWYGLGVETPWFELWILPIRVPRFAQGDYTQKRGLINFGWKPNRSRYEGDLYWLRSLQV